MSGHHYFLEKSNLILHNILNSISNGIDMMTLVKLNIWIRTNRREQEREEKSWNPILALLTTICRPFIRLGLMFKIFLKSICLEVSISYLKYDNLHKVGKKIPILWFWKFYDFCIGKPETLAKGFGNRTFLRPISKSYMAIKNINKPLLHARLLLRERDFLWTY